jgi:hypothetical protein
MIFVVIANKYGGNQFHRIMANEEAYASDRALHALPS